MKQFLAVNTVFISIAALLEMFMGCSGILVLTVEHTIYLDIVNLLHSATTARNHMTSSSLYNARRWILSKSKRVPSLVISNNYIFLRKSITCWLMSLKVSNHLISWSVDALPFLHFTVFGKTGTRITFMQEAGNSEKFAFMIIFSYWGSEPTPGSVLEYKVPRHILIALPFLRNLLKKRVVEPLRT